MSTVTHESVALHVLSPLPYEENALEPVISAKTVGLHYNKHHKGYVDTLNKLVSGTEFEGQTLEKIITATAGKVDKAPIFNNAGQAWNHKLYWSSLSPKGGGEPPAQLKTRLELSFKSVDEFKKEFSTIAVSQFGSGWVWLVLDGDKLKIIKTSNADNPLTQKLKALLGIDLWEHSYYLDYQNRRVDYVNAILDKLINWETALANLG